MNDIKYLLQEWLNGSELEYRASDYCEWQTMEKGDPINPMSYGECYQFRVKPVKQIIKIPVKNKVDNIECFYNDKDKSIVIKFDEETR
jgi:hypothetical protein